ncbi:hypothetical protein P691DRAFT_790903 [Macrolepiota fuliginosa MF-IS2]|uniref:Uncharacterized protein n=1 Tax=Macrolepiota fuliginosa MF-IS2 TaxID=1400762 RepID=A0A9P5WYZ4_9AGAR|nr:hypothetical protein P691DRAFT_790903 [Macrolepiota fuliginosa MF-IS2]
MPSGVLLGQQQSSSLSSLWWVLGSIELSLVLKGMTCGLAVDALLLKHWTVGPTLASPHFEEPQFPFSSGCGINGPTPGWSLSGPIITLVVDTVTMGAVIWGKSRKYHTPVMNPLLKKIHQDAIVYFCAKCCTVIGFGAQTSGPVMTLRIGGVVTCVLASRMILELKEYGNHTSSFGQDIAFSMSELSTLRFGPHGPLDVTTDDEYPGGSIPMR